MPWTAVLVRSLADISPPSIVQKRTERLWLQILSIGGGSWITTGCGNRIEPPAFSAVHATVIEP